MPDVKTYKVGKDVFDIPLKEEQDFLKTYPKATEVESYISGKDTFDIPKQEVQDFLKEYPQAKPLKKKRLFGCIFRYFSGRFSIRISWAGKYIEITKY